MKVSKGRADRIQRRNGHIADDPECRYWTGDFAGVKLRAECRVCRNPTGQEPVAQ